LATLLRTFFFFAIVSPCFSRLAPFAVQSAKSALAFRLAANRARHAPRKRGG
jgi:hypothetical protein